jgi:phosphatidylglycerophosphatase A
VSGRVKLFLATGFGSGRSPFAPGTAGSIVAVGLFWLCWRWSPAWVPPLAFVAVTAAGFLTAGAAAEALGKKDPGAVVIDEFAGQFLALLWIPRGWAWWLAAFALFRLFDITKPPPARQWDRRPGALGIMADDLVAGLYANLLLQAAAFVWPPG